MNIWKYTHNGQTFGPVEIAQLQRLIDTGMLNADSPLQKEGSTEWVPAKSVPELIFPATQSTAGASQLPPVGGTSSSAPPSSPALDADADDVDKNKVFAILAYIGILFIVPLLAAPNSKFARYHANQGIVLFLSAAVVMIGSMVLAASPLGCILWLAPLIVSIGTVILMVIGILNAANGQCKPLPLVGHFKILK